MSTAGEQSKAKRTVLKTTCPRDCYDACGILVVLDQDQVLQVRGDPDHPISRGKLCRKCSIGYNNVWLDPKARLTQPLKRSGAKGEGRFETISWDIALNEIAARLKDIVATHGAHTILNTHYSGTFALLGFHFPMRFFNRLGATEVSPDTICNNAGHVALEYVYGSSLTGFDPACIDDSECVMVWGANPYASAPHQYEHWLEKAQGKLVVIDPIVTPTAAKADLHLQAFPGSDAALAFTIMHVLLRDGLIDTDFIQQYTVGWETLKPAFADCTPAWAEQTTGVSAQAIERAAHMYGSGPALLWVGQGMQRQARGGNAMRACAMLPAITGNIGRAGAGILYLNGPESRGIDEAYLTGSELAQQTPPSISQMDLAETLEDPNQSRALFCWNINNVASNPEQARLKQALKRQDLLSVVIDVFPTDTCDYADYVLPAASFLESDDLFASYFDLTLSAQQKVIEPMGEALPNSEIFRRLASTMGYTEAALFQSDQAIIDRVLADSYIDENFDSLCKKGTVAVSSEPIIQFANRQFPTPSGRIEMASAQAQADGLPLVPEAHADPRPDKDRLRLLSPASHWSLNDSFANDAKIQTQLGPAHVAIHPDEAKARNLNEGDQVMLSNATGKLELSLKISELVPRGVALSNKGRWPKLEPARANVNVLNPGLKSDMGESTCVHSVEVTLTPT